MPDSTLSEELRRFILSSIPSVPYLEAMLLLRAERDRLWDVGTVANRLYIADRRAQELLDELHETGVIDRVDQGYLYRPKTAELGRAIDELETVYAKHLIEVANLIHSKTDRKAQQFAEAFRWRKENP